MKRIGTLAALVSAILLSACSAGDVASLVKRLCKFEASASAIVEIVKLVYPNIGSIGVGEATKLADQICAAYNAQKSKLSIEAFARNRHIVVPVTVVGADGKKHTVAVPGTRE